MTMAALEGFAEQTFTHDGTTRAVFVAGTGPAVIVIHEMPGLTPHVAAFGQRVVDAGFHVRMPSLFGEPGRPMSTGYVAQSLASGCVAKEFVDDVRLWRVKRSRVMSDVLG